MIFVKIWKKQAKQQRALIGGAENNNINKDEGEGFTGKHCEVCGGDIHDQERWWSYSLHATSMNP